MQIAFAHLQQKNAGLVYSDKISVLRFDLPIGRVSFRSLFVDFVNRKLISL